MASGGALRLICISFLICLVGCAGSSKTNFFKLSAMRFLTPTSDLETRDFSLGVGPVSIPDYLNRPQIVTRLSSYSVGISEFDRWADSLEKSIPRVISENISTLLATNRVYTYPWRQGTPRFQVMMDIVQFEGSIPGNVEFLSRWTLLKDGAETPIVNARFHCQKPIAGQGYEGMVSAMSLVLLEMSRHISETIASEFPGEGTNPK